MVICLDHVTVARTPNTFPRRPLLAHRNTHQVYVGVSIAAGSFARTCAGGWNEPSACAFFRNAPCSGSGAVTVRPGGRPRSCLQHACSKLIRVVLIGCSLLATHQQSRTADHSHRTHEASNCHNR